jgi:hypothetical protein
MKVMLPIALLTTAAIVAAPAAAAAETMARTAWHVPQEGLVLARALYK